MLPFLAALLSLPVHYVRREKRYHYDWPTTTLFRLADTYHFFLPDYNHPRSIGGARDFAKITDVQLPFVGIRAARKLTIPGVCR